jgi:hypothetical protein
MDNIVILVGVVNLIPSDEAVVVHHQHCLGVDDTITV